jgi:putative transposase
MVSAQARREQASHAIDRGLSERKACALLSLSRTQLHYAHKMPVKDAPVITAMKTLSGLYPRFGSRRIRIFLQRDGINLGKERCGRLWAKAGLQVPKKRRRRRVGTTLRPLAPNARNSVWSYDFVYDACANGQNIKCLTVVDEYTRECLAIDVSGAIRSSRVIEVLSRLMKTHGMPRYLRSDNGPEFVSKALLEWATKESLQLALIDPGKPWQNGTNESFNGKFRDECLSMEWFRNRIEAKVVIGDWRVHYNTVRPHSSLDYRTPNEFIATLGDNLTTGANFSM